MCLPAAPFAPSHHESLVATTACAVGGDGIDRMGTLSGRTRRSHHASCLRYSGRRRCVEVVTRGIAAEAVYDESGGPDQGEGVVRDPVVVAVFEDPGEEGPATDASDHKKRPEAVDPGILAHPKSIDEHERVQHEQVAHRAAQDECSDEDRWLRVGIGEQIETDELHADQERCEPAKGDLDGCHASDQPSHNARHCEGGERSARGGARQAVFRQTEDVLDRADLAAHDQDKTNGHEHEEP